MNLILVMSPAFSLMGWYEQHLWRLNPRTGYPSRHSVLRAGSGDTIGADRDVDVHPQWVE